MGHLFKRVTMAAALMLCAACTTSQTEVPPLTGPSELALSVRMAAIPDSISQDGASQSAVVVTVFDANGRPCPNVPLRLEMGIGGQVQDFGALSARTIVTGSDGKASVTYTAPPAPPPLAGGSGNTVTILATPSSSVNCNSNQAVGNFDASNRQQVSIRLVPPGVILAPAGSPTAAFTMSPTAAVQNAPVAFDASTSTPGAGAAQITSYVWNFGDGTPDASGRTVTHRFTSQQTFNVTLTVTNDRGLSASSRVATPVGAPPAATPPTPSFTFSPSAPGVGDTIFFNASTSTAQSGHTIASYEWTFGDGATGSGVTVTHAYGVAGTYVVQLKVTDEIGQSATTTGTSITPGSGTPAPGPKFTFSPTSPGRFDQVVFDSSSSTITPGQTIVDVAWNFGDGTAIIHCPGGSAADCPGPTNRISTHVFQTNATFAVNLVMTDSAGRTASVTQNVTVVLAEPTVRITVSPGAPTPGTTVSFNSDGTTYFAGSNPPSFPVSFAWSFGDGSTSTLANPVKVGGYAAVGTYTVTLSVTDNKGRTGVGTASVTVAAATPPATTPPTAAFSFSQPSQLHPSTVFFNGSGSTGTGLTYAWNFGDGTFGTGATPTKVYAVAGQYNVTLTVTDSSAAHATSAPQTVTVQ